MQSTGNATDFGDLICRRFVMVVDQMQLVVIILGATESTANNKYLDFITIATTGNAVDFGALT